MLRSGLSPRLRGNLIVAPSIVPSIGSIPAPAGEPARRSATCRWRWVYPRACGGTSGPLRRSSSIPGLSPRLRGNPDNLLRETRICKVYPRACGGTGGKVIDPTCKLRKRSIPAPAGEPPSPWSCGTRAGLGLSPRLRGNHSSNWPDSQTVLPRSIPAPAGEPCK